MDYFVEDKKIVDPMVLADMKLAADTPRDVILFNIDSRVKRMASKTRMPSSMYSSKSSIKCRASAGPSPMLPIWNGGFPRKDATMSSRLLSRKNTGDPWEESRQDFDFIQDSVVDALVSMGFYERSCGEKLV